MSPMSIASISAPVPIAPPLQSSPPKTPDKSPDVNTAAPDGTRVPKPTELAALPPGQGTRVDQLA